MVREIGVAATVGQLGLVDTDVMAEPTLPDIEERRI
jgi:hypothetical protein